MLNLYQAYGMIRYRIRVCSVPARIFGISIRGSTVYGTAVSSIQDGSKPYQSPTEGRRPGIEGIMEASSVQVRWISSWAKLYKEFDTVWYSTIHCLIQYKTPFGGKLYHTYDMMVTYRPLALKVRYIPYSDKWGSETLTKNLQFKAI